MLDHAAASCSARSASSGLPIRVDAAASIAASRSMSFGIGAGRWAHGPANARCWTSSSPRPCGRLKSASEDAMRAALPGGSCTVARGARRSTTAIPRRWLEVRRADSGETAAGRIRMACRRGARIPAPGIEIKAVRKAKAGERMRWTCGRRWRSLTTESRPDGGARALRAGWCLTRAGHAQARSAGESGGRAARR